MDMELLHPLTRYTLHVISLLWQDSFLHFSHLDTLVRKMLRVHTKLTYHLYLLFQSFFGWHGIIVEQITHYTHCTKKSWLQSLFTTKRERGYVSPLLTFKEKKTTWITRKKNMTRKFSLLYTNAGCLYLSGGCVFWFRFSFPSDTQKTYLQTDFLVLCPSNIRAILKTSEDFLWYFIELNTKLNQRDPIRNITDGNMVFYEAKAKQWSRKRRPSVFTALQTKNLCSTLWINPSIDRVIWLTDMEVFKAMGSSFNFIVLSGLIYDSPLLEIKFPFGVSLIPHILHFAKSKTSFPSWLNRHKVLFLTVETVHLTHLLFVVVLNSRKMSKSVSSKAPLPTILLICIILHVACQAMHL